MNEDIPHSNDIAPGHFRVNVPKLSAQASGSLTNDLKMMNDPDPDAVRFHQIARRPSCSNSRISRMGQEASPALKFHEEVDIAVGSGVTTGEGSEHAQILGAVACG